jgi:hypothetical protein
VAWVEWVVVLEGVREQAGSLLFLMTARSKVYGDYVVVVESKALRGRSFAIEIGPSRGRVSPLSDDQIALRGLFQRSQTRGGLINRIYFGANRLYGFWPEFRSFERGICISD